MATQLKPVDTRPNEAPAVYRAIAAVMGEIGAEGIAKGRRNSQQGYQFRGIDDIYNALNPIMARHRLCMFPRVLDLTSTERETARGGVLFYVRMKVEFDFVSAEDGSSHTAVVMGEAMDSADKATNKAMSAAQKYACLQTFCIPTEGDNDADSTTHEVAPRRETARDRARRESDANGGVHPNNAEEDFNAAKAAEVVMKAMRGAASKAALDTVWRDQRELRARIKAADETQHANLVEQFSAEAKRIAEAGDILDDQIPY